MTQNKATARKKQAKSRKEVDPNTLKQPPEGQGNPANREHRERNKNKKKRQKGRI